MPTRVVRAILEQHVEEAASLRTTRRVLLHAPHVNLRDLLRHDSRIEAQLDALAIAGKESWPLCRAALDDPSQGSLFTAAVRVIEDQEFDRFESLLVLAEALPAGRSAIVSALGWLDPSKLRGLVSGLLRSNQAVRRLVGIAACAVHRVDPGLRSNRLIEDKVPAVRSRALRTAGELGHTQLLSSCVAAIDDEDPDCKFWAAMSGVLLGDRNRALETLTHIGLENGRYSEAAMLVSLMSASPSDAHSLLQQISKLPENLALLLKGGGIAGDPIYAPWLLGHMESARSARLAGQAFSFITGADLVMLKLARTSASDHQPTPNEDPEDTNVEIDQDDDLPWPDVEKVSSWWKANSQQFRSGVRHFMGRQTNEETCVRTLRQGYQRQRIAAAVHLALLSPGTPLFEWRAPAARQQRLLAAMT